MKTFALLLLDCFCYTRWLLLKAVAPVINAVCHLCGQAHLAELATIRFGNLLFPMRWPKDLFDSYDSYDRGYPADLRPYLSLAPAEQWLVGKDVLDLGAGLGGYSRELRARGARHVTSLEYQFSKALYSFRRGGCGNAVVSGSASALPFAAQTFDSVLSNTVFEHLPDVRAALREVHRVLRSGGLALIGFNFFHHRGGHHLFPYVHFPWPTWVVSETALCRYWSSRLKHDQEQGRMNFYPKGSCVESLAEGNEISLNKMTYETFERIVPEVGLRIEARVASETIARIFPNLVAAMPLRRFLTGSVFYALRRVPDDVNGRAE